MSDFITVESNIESVQKQLATTSKSIKSISKSVLRIIAKGTVKAVKAHIRETMVKRTGELLKCYGYKVHDRNGSLHVTVAPRGKSGDEIFKKAYVQSFGYNGNVPRAWNKAHEFAQKGHEFAQGNAYMNDVQKMVEKELLKQWG